MSANRNIDACSDIANVLGGNGVGSFLTAFPPNTDVGFDDSDFHITGKGLIVNGEYKMEFNSQTLVYNDSMFRETASVTCRKIRFSQSDSPEGFDSRLQANNLILNRSIGYYTTIVDSDMISVNKIAIKELTPNHLPVAKIAGLFQDSCFSDDGNVAFCARKLNLFPADVENASLNIPTCSSYPTILLNGDIFSDANSTYLFGKNHRVIRSSSDVIGQGAGIGLVDAVSFTKAWQMQLGSNNDLAFWNYNAGWNRRIQFSTNGGIGFFGTIAPLTKPTITGSRLGSPALLDLLTKLSACGIIADGTSA